MTCEGIQPILLWTVRTAEMAYIMQDHEDMAKSSGEGDYGKNIAEKTGLGSQNLMTAKAGAAQLSMLSATVRKTR